MKRLVLLMILVALVVVVVPPMLAWCWTSRYDFSDATHTEADKAAEVARAAFGAVPASVEMRRGDANRYTLVGFLEPTHKLDLQDPNYLTDDSIRLLCRSGRVCRITWHQWNFIPDSRLWECGLCGKQKSHWTDETMKENQP